MTVTFNRNLEYASIYMGIQMNGNGCPGFGDGSQTAITVYSGAQPTAATILSNWASYNSTNSIFLAHFVGASWTQALNNTANFISMTTFPAAVPAINSGTASWAIIWLNNPPLSSMGGSLPEDKFVICNVSTLTGSGIIKFDPDLTFTQGVNKLIADGAILASLP